METQKKILVTGGAGYLGSILCRKLIAKGYWVICVDPCLHGEKPIADLLQNSSFFLLKKDLRNIADVSRLLDGCYAIIHLAALVGDVACNLNESETVQINYLCTMALAEAALLYKVERFLFAGTTSVYGSGKNILYEGSHTNPLSIYAKTKLQCEHALLKISSINPTILRTATVYGLSPRMRFDLVVNVMVAKAVKNGKIEVYGGEQWRPFIHVDDITEVYILILEAPLWRVSSQIFNVVSENHTISEVAQIIAKQYPNTKIEAHPTSIDKRDYCVSNDKLITTLQFKPRNTILEEVPKIGAWLLENNVDISSAIYSNEKTLRKTYQELLIEGETDKI
ncbi:MAG: SDR family oxidoreductase [Nanoarchaeota archaeon]